MSSYKDILFMGLMLASGSLVGASAAAASTDAANVISSITTSGGFDLSALFQASIPLLTAGGISLVKFFVPKIPRPILPFLSPILGAGTEIFAYLTGLSESSSPLRGALLGACGVFVHEALAQTKKILTSEQENESI